MLPNSEMMKKSNPPERYKIKVSGLPRFYAMADPLLQEFLKCIRHELKLNCIYARFVRKGNAWLYLTFPTAEEQQKALNALKRYNWKGRTLVSMLVTSDVLKRKTDGSEDEVISYDSKKQKIDIPISEQVLMSTIPYHSLSYLEQEASISVDPVLIVYFRSCLLDVLKKINITEKCSVNVRGRINSHLMLCNVILDFSLWASEVVEFLFVCVEWTLAFFIGQRRGKLRQKNEEAYSLVCRLHEILTKRGPQLVAWCSNRRKQLNSSIPFILDNIRPSPVVDCYRNKYEFSVGLNPDTETVAVGIRVQDRRDGIHHVGPAEGLRHLPKPMISLVEVFERFVIERGDEWDFWYHLIVRINRRGEIMVTVSTNPNKKLLSDEKMEDLKNEVRKCFSSTSENVVSLYFQIHGDKPISDTVGIPSKSELLWGEDHIKEKLLDLELEITPVTYFRINSAAAEVLCRSVAELANVDKDTTLLDLFCGSGSLALTLAPKCKEVIAVELIETNIRDARRYAEINSITNCEFIAGKIEDIIHSILNKLRTKKVVVILDPPRTGVDPVLVKTLREFKEAIRFIYVCSNHKLPLKNLLDFSSLSGNVSDPDPIIPVRIVPIDMTPHTLRSELVILCERFDLSLLNSRPRNNIELCNTNRVDISNPSKSFHPSHMPPPNGSSKPTNATHPKFLNFSNSQHSNRMPGFLAPPSTSYSNRFSSPSFPPRVPPFDSSNTFDDGSLNDFFAEERYSSFRRDFENAIDSSYTPFDSSVNTPEFLPLEMVRKIEERAFREGLTRGIQQCAYQVGYQLGLRSSAEKLLNYDDLLGFIGNSASSNNSNTSRSSNVWDNTKFPASATNESTLLTSTLSSSSSSPLSNTWNLNEGSTSSNSNGFQMWSQSTNNELTNSSGGKIPSTHNSLWK